MRKQQDKNSVNKEIEQTKCLEIWYISSLDSVVINILDFGLLYVSEIETELQIQSSYCCWRFDTSFVVVLLPFAFICFKNVSTFCQSYFKRVNNRIYCIHRHIPTWWHHFTLNSHRIVISLCTCSLVFCFFLAQSSLLP